MYDRLARESQRHAKRLFSKSDLLLATQIAGEANAEWRMASVTVGGDASRLVALKASARQKLDRKLARALPNYRKWQALQRARLSAQRELANLSFAGPASGEIHVAWGDLVATDAPDTEEFGAPFTHFEVETTDVNSHIDPDNCYVVPDRGYVVNDIVFDHDEDTPAIIGVFGLHRPELASNIVSCGIRYTMPGSGRLQIGGVLQNYASSVAASIDDSFGFSFSVFDVRVELFVAVVQPSRVIYLPTTLISIPLDSDGDDESFTAPALDTSLPYGVSGSTGESFDAGDSMQIMVGSAVHISSQADDMTNHVSAKLEWRLDKITVAVI